MVRPRRSALQYGSGAPARHLPRSVGESRHPSAATGRRHVLGSLAELGLGRRGRHAVGGGPGCDDAGCAVRHFDDQCSVPGLCGADPVEDPASRRETSLETGVGSPVERLARARAGDLDRDRPRRPRLICQVVVRGNHPPRLASPAARQSGRLLSPGRLVSLVPLSPVGPRRWPALGRVGDRVYPPENPLAVYLVGVLGSRACRPVGHRDRPATPRGRGLLVRLTRLDRNRPAIQPP